MRKGLIQREIGVGIGRAGSRGSPAELPESGPPGQPEPAWQGLSTQFPGTEGIWAGMMTAPEMAQTEPSEAFPIR